MKAILKYRAVLLLIALVCNFAQIAHASGPRWVTGKPYYPTEGVIIVWYTNTPKYFTDPGDLSPYVNHTAADALVAAAANVWTVPTSSLTLSYGGPLAEHLSSANIYPTTSGLVFPADVQSINYFNKQIAILYDYDGSITDLMLGTGASSPSSCRQNAVTESVDSISTTGFIQHALLILNGRCTGPAPEQQLQLQYQLMRAFGRILGLAWSQTNDNVFTGNPRPTVQQAEHWPIMHPLDIICGPYTYQCLPDPFTLRDDDLSGLGLLYPTGRPATTFPGKTDTLARASRQRGTVTFPNGQGMQGVNVVIHRLQALWSIPEAWESTSAVTGARFRRRSSTPINTLASSATSNMGSSSSTLEGYYDIYRTPIIGTDIWQNLIVSTQPINPLYTGPYAVGPYDSNVVAPSGSPVQQQFNVTQAYAQETINFNIPDAASGCQTTQDGVETSPALTPATGWWAGNLCTYGHASWSSLAIQSNRSLTFEVTALDENSFSTSAKAMPVLGLWNAGDSTGTLPTLASSPNAFNSSATGMTTLTTQTTQPRQLRIAIMDQRGDGRPDYAYQARILYADCVSPATLPSKGGPITITGMGFRAGNTVTINGIATDVSSWTANTITATAPSLHSSHAITADVAIRDLATGGVTTMTAALSYTAPQPELDLVSAPSGSIFTNVLAATPFAVKAIAADGTSPLANTSVTLAATTGQVLFSACGQPTCTLLTDATGVVSSTLTPLSDGPITLTATSSIGAVTASFNAFTRIQTITPASSTLYLAEGAVISWPLQVTLADNGASTVGVPVQWTASSPQFSFAPSTSSTDTQSIAQTTATAGPLPGGTQATATACAWTSICTAFAVNGVPSSDLQLTVPTGLQRTIAVPIPFTPITLTVTDSAGHPVAGAVVTIHQTVEPWLPPCTDPGRCPIAPTYGSSITTLISNLDGTVTFSPLELPGGPDQPQVTHVAVATGTQGFLSFTLTRNP